MRNRFISHRQIQTFTAHSPSACSGSFETQRSLRISATDPHRQSQTTTVRSKGTWPSRCHRTSKLVQWHQSPICPASFRLAAPSSARSLSEPDIESHLRRSSRGGRLRLWLKKAPVRGSNAKHENTRRRKLERHVHLGLQLPPPCVGFEPACFLCGSLCL